MKKRVIVSVLALTICVGMLAACGEKKEQETATTAPTATTQEETTQENTEDTGNAADTNTVDTPSEAADNTTDTDTVDTPSEAADNTTDTDTVDAPSEEADNAADTNVAEFTSDDGIDLLISIFGETDAETGNENSFGFIENTTVDGVEYYAYQYKWLVGGDHLSSVADVFITTDGKSVYEGTYVPDGASQIDTADNFVK